MKLGDDASKLTPEARALASKTRAKACARYILTGEAAADEIDGNKLSCADGADVIESIRLRVVPLENEATERIFLDLPDDGAEASPFESQLKAADAAEERAYRQHRAFLPTDAIARHTATTIHPAMLGPRLRCARDTEAATDSVWLRAH